MQRIRKNSRELAYIRGSNHNAYGFVPVLDRPDSFLVILELTSPCPPSL